MSDKKPSYKQVKDKSWLISSVLNEFERIAGGTGHGKIIITIQNAEVFEIEVSTKRRNPKFIKGTVNKINTCKLDKI